MGEIVGNIDGAQVVLYAFWVFFAGLIWYLQAESRREGYPLESDLTGEYNRDAWLQMPAPKAFVLPHGQGTRYFPDPVHRDTRPIAAVRASRASGAPLIPTGNPMIDGVGPAAWVDRPDYPDAMPHGEPKIVPMSVAPEIQIAKADADPRGMNVVAADGVMVGEVTDIWVDKMENYIRYLQVKFGRNQRLIPIHFAVQRDGRGWDVREYYVHNLTAAQFKDIPKLKSADQITLLEEDKIMGYFGGGEMYAMAGRAEPVL